MVLANPRYKSDLLPRVCLALDPVYVFYIGLARTIYIRCIYGTFAGKLQNIQSYTVYTYGSGRP
jgi:hypothetical protein